MVTYSDDASILLSSTLTPTKGLHTTSTTRLALHRGDRRRSPCTLHLYFTLPTQLFADPYELTHRRESYRFERFGGGNLEAPVFAPGAGADAPSGLLLDLIVPEGGEAVDDVGIGGEGDGDGEDGRVVQIDVPLHARYGVPKMGGGERIDEVTLPIPEAFWACPATNSRNIEGAPPVIHTRSFFFFFFFFWLGRLAERIKFLPTIILRMSQQSSTCKCPMRYVKWSSSHLRSLVAARGRSSRFRVQSRFARRRFGCLLAMREMWRWWRQVRSWLCCLRLCISFGRFVPVPDLELELYM